MCRGLLTSSGFGFLFLLVACFYYEIQWKNQKKGGVLNDCLVSVDGTDFQIAYNGRKFFLTNTSLALLSVPPVWPSIIVGLDLINTFMFNMLLGNRKDQLVPGMFTFVVP
jgi:hypothetical protein